MCEIKILEFRNKNDSLSNSKIKKMPRFQNFKSFQIHVKCQSRTCPETLRKFKF